MLAFVWRYDVKEAAFIWRSRIIVAFFSLASPREKKQKRRGQPTMLPALMHTAPSPLAEPAAPLPSSFLSRS